MDNSGGMKTNLLTKSPSFLIQIGALALALICFSTQAHAGPVLPAVGPNSTAQSDMVSRGDLVVYSATTQGVFGCGDYFYPHSAYWIYNTSGKTVRTVRNHGTFPEAGPSTVQLAPGTYTVRAWSDSQGLVTVPVIIKSAQTTVVHLDNDRLSKN